jgi:hypothetical protein
LGEPAAPQEKVCPISADDSDANLHKDPMLLHQRLQQQQQTANNCGLQADSPATTRNSCQQDSGDLDQTRFVCYMGRRLPTFVISPLQDRRVSPIEEEGPSHVALILLFAGPGWFSSCCVWSGLLLGLDGF